MAAETEFVAPGSEEHHTYDLYVGSADESSDAPRPDSIYVRLEDPRTRDFYVTRISRADVTRLTIYLGEWLMHGRFE